jgi:hypothetical protein
MTHQTAGKPISRPRKAAYYLGAALMLAGFVTFLSVFVTAASHFGDFSNFDADARSSMLRGVIGMVLMIAGAAVRAIGASGLAGSGVVLDPAKAREDLQPYSHMAGRIVKDALDAADVDLGRRDGGEKVMIRCQACRKLNEEDSKFCQECGKPL